jgi:hypothetical protein
LDLSNRLEITVVSSNINGFIKVLKSFKKLDIRLVGFDSADGVVSYADGEELGYED